MNHAICIPAWNWSNLEGLTDEIVFQDQENLFYTFHFYEPHELTHSKLTTQEYPGYFGTGKGRFLANKEWIDRRFHKAVEFRRKHRAPVLLGEFGCMGNAPGESALRYVEDVINGAESAKIPWCYWTYKVTRGPYGFALIHNERDKQQPPRFMIWNEMVDILKPHFMRNKISF